MAPSDAVSSEIQSFWKSEFKSLQLEHAGLQRNYSSLKEKHTVKLAALDFHCRRSKELENKVKKCEDHVAWLENQKETEEESYTAVFGENDRLTTENISLEKQVAAAQKQQNWLEARNTELLKANTVLEKLNKDNEKKLRTKSAELQSVSMKLAKNLKNGSRYNNDSQATSFKAERIMFKAAKLSLEQQNRSLTEELKSLRAKLQYLLDEFSPLETRNKDLESKLKAINIELDISRQYNVQVDTIVEERNRLQVANLSLGQEKASLTNEKTRLVIKTEDLLEDISVLETRIEELETKLVEASSSEQDICNCKAQIAQYEAKEKIDQEVFKAQLSIKDHQITTLEGKLANVTEKVQQLTSELSEKMEASNDNKELVGNLKEEVDILQEKYNQLYAENLEVIAALQEEQQENNLQKEANSEFQLNLIKNKEEIGALSQRVNTMSGARIHMDKKLAILLEKLEEFEGIYDNFQTKCDGVVNSHNESAPKLFSFLTTLVSSKFVNLEQFLLHLKERSSLGTKTESATQETRQKPIMEEETVARSALNNVIEPGADSNAQSPLVNKRNSSTSLSSNLCKVRKISPDEDIEVNIES